MALKMGHCIKSTENTVQYCFIHAVVYILYLSSPVYPFPPCCFNFIASQCVMKTKHDTFPTTVECGWLQPAYLVEEAT